jgi:putative hydrolase of the HAD superfamily
VEPLGGLGGEHDDLWHRMLAHEVSERAYWAQRSTELGTALGVAEGGTRALMQVLYGGPAEDWLQQEVLDLMADVRAAGLPLGALTNDLAAFHAQEWIDQQAWLGMFDVVVDGSRTGVLKPDPKAFTAATQALGLPPEDVVFLDDMPWNVDGGLAAGLQAIRLEQGHPGPGIAEARHRLGLTPTTR